MGSIDKQDTTPQLLNRLRMRQIALILAIEDRRTLRAAAGQLGLTQPAATKMLHELESALGQSLFDRVGRGLQLNPAGERVTGYFRSIRGSMEALNRELGELRLGSAGKFSVGSIMAASPGHLTEALLGLKALFPLLSVEIAVDTSDRLLAQLREGVLEVVIGRLVSQPGFDCVFRAIEDEGLADAAPYALCLGYRIRYVLDLNAREAMHLIELRSGREGHPTYRAVAQAMYERIAAVHPAIALTMTHVDSSREPRLERILSEIRTHRKGAAATRG